MFGDTNVMHSRLGRLRNYAMYLDAIVPIASSRKRPRTCEDEACDLMPISKRINDLHIRSGNLSDVSSRHSDRVSHIQPQSIYHNMATVEQVPGTVNMNGHITPNGHPAGAEYDLCHYSPELSAIQNPYYYHINEVLFEAHINRLQRLSTSGPSVKY